MPRYKVTYTDCCIRECFINAKSEDAAEELARAECENGEHHHTWDAWTDDWQVEPALKKSTQSGRCWECSR